MKRQRIYDPVGRCIYCGGDGKAGQLTNEHIIAESLGGMLILQKASCNECAVKTGAFEGHNAGNLFRPIRRQFRFPSKSRGRKDREKKLAQTFEIQVGRRTVKVRPEEYPGILFSFQFPTPDFMLGLPAREGFAGKINLTLLPEFGARLAALQSRFPGQEVSLPTKGYSELVGRLIAKTAHSYAVAELGLGKFKPFLLDIILSSKPSAIGNFVGSSEAINLFKDDLHEISIDDGGELLDPRFVLVKLQLFADRGFAVHYAIVGERL